MTNGVGYIDFRGSILLNALYNFRGIEKSADLSTVDPCTTWV